MKVMRFLSVVVCAALVACTPVQKNENNDVFTSLLKGDPSLADAQQIYSLVNSVSSGLGISESQASTSSLSILSFAQEKLSPSSSRELTSILGGVYLPNITGSMNSVSSISSNLNDMGLNSNMISTLSSLLSGYLQNQGASASLLSEFSNLLTLI